MKLLFLFLLAASVLRADDALLLRAIAEVETGGRNVIGRHGETGATQMGPAARQDNGTPQKHLEWIKRALVLNGFAVTPFSIALAWNAGIERMAERRVLPRHYAYAESVVNLYRDFGGH
jgi:hypothetical protein